MDDVIHASRHPRRVPFKATYHVNCDLCHGEGCDLCGGRDNGGNGVPREWDDGSDDDSTSSSSNCDISTMNDSDNDNGDKDIDGNEVSTQEKQNTGKDDNKKSNNDNDNDFRLKRTLGFHRRWIHRKPKPESKHNQENLVEETTVNSDKPIETRIKRSHSKEILFPSKTNILISPANGSDDSDATKTKVSERMIEKDKNSKAETKGLGEDSNLGSNCQSDYRNKPDKVDTVQKGKDRSVNFGGVSVVVQGEEEAEELEGSHIHKPGLMRKSAVRRKGYNWTSKSMPRTGPCSLQVDHYPRKGSSLQPGSSLELAPSLLNIYDDIASSNTETNDTNSLSPQNKGLLQNQHAPSFSSSSPPSSLPLHHRDSATSVPIASPCSPNSPPTLSRVPYRNVKLPSLSQPMDRPVSLMDAETAMVQTDAHIAVDSKKRPLSVSSASSVSTSSLPRIRKKRQSGNSCGCNQIENESDKTGYSCNNNNVSPNRESKHRMMCSAMVSESHSSMDSGCIENDHNGDRYFDDMSIASSSEAGSIRDDMSSGIQDFVDTSQSSLGVDNNGSSQTTPPGHKNGFEFLGRSKSVTPEGEKFPGNNSMEVEDEERDSNVRKDDDSDVMRRMGSYLVRSSPKEGVDSPTDDHNSMFVYGDLNGGLSRAEEKRRIDSISRSEARQRFFSNYEERYSKTYLAPKKETEPDYEVLTDSTEPPLSSHPTNGTDDKEFLEEQPPFPESPSQTSTRETTPVTETPIVSVASSTTASPPTSPTCSSHNSCRRSTSVRSSRKRESGKSGEITPTPSSPVYVTYVQRVVAEIVESERTYISSLEDIIFGYLEPLEGTLNMEAAKDDIMCLFSNIREIYGFGRVFLADLEETSGDPIKVAECIVRHNKGFVIYTEYCTNYPSAVEVLTRFMQHSDLSKLCKERQTALGHGLPLGAYLLKPVQRILKYHLLLQNIVKSYEKENKEVPVLKQAFQHMTEMAHHINEMKRKHEHAVRIQEIQSQLEDYSGEDLTRLGELVLESTFRIYGAKASRQVFLFERGLLISKKKEGGMLSCKTFIKCSNLMLVEVIPNEPLSFHAIPFDNPRAQYTLQARNMEQKRRWCQEIKRLILESFKGRIPESVKSLVMELGREHDDDYVTKESLDAVRKHQHTAPEYLEKRRVRRKSGSRMPDFSLLKPNKAKRNGQRKEEKSNSRFFLEPGRRAESKSPDSHHRIFSKLIMPQSRSQSHSLPNSPMTESSSPSHVLYAPNYATKTTSPLSSPDKAASQSPISTVIPTSTSTPVSDLIPHKSDNLNDNSVVKRAHSFRAAVKTNPITSQDMNDINEPTDDSEISKNNIKSVEDRHKSHHDQRSESSEEEDDDYVMIKQDDEAYSPPISHNQGGDTLDIQNNECDSVMCSVIEKCDSRSSSLPLLMDDDNIEVENKSVRNQYQSSDNINHPHVSRGRMSRRDLQNAFGGRNSRKNVNQNTSSNIISNEKENMKEEIIKTADSNERLDQAEKKDSRIPNTSQNSNIPDPRISQHIDVVRARLTNWNSVDKLTKGSMSDLSQIHEDPWVVNAQTKNSSSEQTGPATSSLDSNSSASNSSSSLQNLSSNPNLNDETLKNKENLDWLVYLKRNCIESNPASVTSQPKRMSTSVLERKSSARQIIDDERRISVHCSPYATPPRYYMTQENMKKFSQSPNGSKTFDKDINFNMLPRWQSTPNTSVTSNLIKEDRPYSLQLQSIPDEKQLRDESNRIVAEMEDYISNTSSSENIKSPNKFPTILPIINIESNAEEEISNESKRLSTVSSVSTSSYDSTSSDGLVGNLKSKLHSWAAQMNKKNEDSDHSGHSTLSSDDENNLEEEKTLTSLTKPKNTFDSPSNQRKSWQEERNLEKVLREHSLGSESLGNRMAHSVPVSAESRKSMPPLQTVPNSSHNANFQNSYHNTENNFMNEKLPPENTRFSMPTTKEATEALMTLSLNSCDIQQSDSGFSLQSNDSTLSDFVERDNYAGLPQAEEKHYESKLTVELKSPGPEEKQKEQKLSRHGSSDSLESTDSIYERRFSLTLNSEELKDSLTIVNVYDDTVSDSPQSLSPLPQRKSIREHVQLIEENTRPRSPKIFEVRKREPGAIIRQRLESLRRNVNYGRSQTCDPMSTRNVSEEREFVRSRSQPPAQYRQNDVVLKTKCNDDIHVKSLNVSINGKNEFPVSRDRVNSLTKSVDKPDMSKSRDSLNLSRSRESLLNLTKSKESLSLSRSKEGVSLCSLSLPRPSSNNTVYHSSTPGHEKDWMRYRCVEDDECPDPNTTNQFVHRVKHESQHQDGHVPSPGQEEIETDGHPETKDHQSSEVDNLVIMKGWVRALITKFQDK